jgi:hypothetical protein
MKVDSPSRIFVPQRVSRVVGRWRQFIIATRLTFPLMFLREQAPVSEFSHGIFDVVVGDE